MKKRNSHYFRVFRENKKPRIVSFDAETRQQAFRNLCFCMFSYLIDTAEYSYTQLYETKDEAFNAIAKRMEGFNIYVDEATRLEYEDFAAKDRKSTDRESEEDYI